MVYAMHISLRGVWVNYYADTNPIFTLNRLMEVPADLISESIEFRHVQNENGIDGHANKASSSLISWNGLHQRNRLLPNDIVNYSDCSKLTINRRTYFLLHYPE